MLPQFLIGFDGAAQVEEVGDFASLEDARNAAITRLGIYLQAHPEYAYAQHWRVDVRDEAGRLRLHVIVGTVLAPSMINFTSYADDARSA